MQLSDIQARFKHQMLGDKDSLPLDEALNSVFDSGQISLEKRLNVYRNGILEKLKNVLGIMYPSVETLTGEDFFRGAAYQYIRHNPPETGDMNVYGDSFPEFLGALPQAGGLPYIEDTALYDLAVNTAYYAADDDAFEPERLGAFTPDDFEKLIFHARASVSLLKSSYPVDEIIDFCSNDSGTKAEPLDITKDGVHLMIFRPEYVVRREHLTQSEYDLLEDLCNGQPLGEALENILKTDPAFDFQTFLGRHVSLGTFTDIHIMEG